MSPPAGAQELRASPRWSSYQEAIFEDAETGTGHTAVIARAGAGKTTVAVEAVRRIPKFYDVLVCAFERTIRDELEKRLKDLSHVHVRTLHQVGYSACRGYTVDKDKDWEIVRDVTGTLRVPGLLADLIRAVGLAKNRLVTTRNEVEECVRYIFETPVKGVPYAQIAEWVAECMKRAADVKGRISFDDMVWLPAMFNWPVRQYDVVVIDELQDLSHAQIKLALASCRPGGRIIGFGDPMQALYKFRGADEDGFRRLIEEMQAKTLKLPISYRCAQAVVKEARRWVPDIEYAPDAPPGSVEEVEAGTFTALIQPGDWALARSNIEAIRLFGQITSVGLGAEINGFKEVRSEIETLIQREKIEDLKRLNDWAAEREDQRNIATAIELLVQTTKKGPLLQRIAQAFAFQSQGGVTVSTIHRAKGREAPRVFVSLRGEMDDNLSYVAATRAKSDLVYVRAPQKGEDK